MSDRIGTGSVGIRLSLSCSQSSVEFIRLFGIPAGYLIGGQILQQILGHPHQQQLRQLFDKESSNPRGHLVCARLPVVYVQYDYGDDDAEADQKHGE